MRQSRPCEAEPRQIGALVGPCQYWHATHAGKRHLIFKIRVRKNLNVDWCSVGSRIIGHQIRGGIAMLSETGTLSNQQVIEDIEWPGEKDIWMQ